MALSRLDNFLKNVRGNILYVNPNDLDATDSVNNQGNSMGRPFITIQRALIEAARFSYQKGLDNDRFGKTTILLAPGEHFVDNRPGWIPIHDTNPNTFRLRDGTTSTDFSPFSSTSNFDISTVNNVLYKLNSVYGGIIIPRGVSIVASDLRKTKIRPKYVPNPENSNIEASALFRITGGCYFWQFSIFDGDPNGLVYKDYTTSTFVPNFSHHRLTCFEYADGVNAVKIDDEFINNYVTTRTDLDMYYEKVGLAYGPASGRNVSPDWPSEGLDIQPKIDEYRIVGPTGGSVGISSIKAGDGVIATKTITVNLSSAVAGLNVDTRFLVNDVSDSAYNGTFVVDSVTTADADGNTTVFKYSVPTAPSSPLLNPPSATVVLDTDTVTSASPYIFNVSLRSVYGMCGMLADGDKSTGFKSMVVAQFTGVSLQTDNKAFVRYNKTTADFDTSTLDGGTIANIASDSLAKYKPSYYNYHIKATNESVIQLVSIFAIGYAEHFVTESGGDFSVTNSNSNFGQIALSSSGYRDDSFDKDDVGYITNIIPPKAVGKSEVKLEYGAIDVSNTLSPTVGVGSTGTLFLYQETNEADAPSSVLQGYRIGAKLDDYINVNVTETGTPINRYARVVMPDTQGDSHKVSSVKISTVGRTVSTGNSIANNTVTFTENHQLLNGETIRFNSDNGRLPDGIENNRVYFAITDSVDDDQIKVAGSLTDAIEGTAVTINKYGGTLRVESRVSDKLAGDLGHPLQYDSNNSQWYVNVSTASSENTIYSTLDRIGVTTVGDATSRTYIERTPDTRSLSDRIYKYRYVIPAGSGITSARPPRDSYIVVESNDVTGKSNTEVALQFSPSSVTMTNSTEMRNFSFIREATYDGGTAKFVSELPHELSVGSQIKTLKITSANNTVGAASSGYNGTYTVAGIQSATQFSVTGMSIDPGTYSNNNNLRTTDLPTFQRIKQNNTYYVYDAEQVKEYKAGEQNGIYYLTLVNSSNTPVISPFNDSSQFSFSQPVRNLYPQYDRDNPDSDPSPSTSYAKSNILGDVVVDEVKKSITKETIDKFEEDFGIGIGITDIISNVAGTAHTIYTDHDCGLQRATRVSISSVGAGYGNGTGATEYLYNAILGPSSTGNYATARVTINASGQLSAAKIMNGGTGYEVGDVLTVVGTATTTGHIIGNVTVQSIYDNVGETIKVAGVTSETVQEYNQLYRVTGVSTHNQIQVASSSSVSAASTISGIGVTVTSDAFVHITGRTLSIKSLAYSPGTGIATVNTYQGHGLRPNNTIHFGGATEDFYNGNFVVTENVGLTTFKADLGIRTDSPTLSGTQYGYRPGAGFQAGNITLYDENFGGRTVDVYAGITTTLQTAVTSTTTENIAIDNLNNQNLNIGDYLRIEDEIVRIKTTVPTGSSTIKVFRGEFGTKPATHIVDSVVTRIFINPVELRRPSIIRASGHTFEYIGFGPGNYSTALPERQGQQPTITEQLISQKFNSDGGVSVYTGMNDRGDFYIGNKRISSTTGKEEVFDTPVPTVTGEDVLSTGQAPGVDLINPLEAKISRSLVVDGGPNNNILSEFNGPVVFSEKLTSTSDDGMEANSLFLQGDTTVSRKYTVGISTPTSAGNPGDITYNANPKKGGTVGWTYTIDNGWYPFGSVSLEVGSDRALFDKVGVGTTTMGDNTFQVGAGGSQFSIHGQGVGIGTTQSTAGAKLQVEGAIVATAFTGDGSGLINIANDSLWNTAGLGTGIHPINNLNVGIGTTQPTLGAKLEVGSPHVSGLGTISLYSNNMSHFIETSFFQGDIIVPHSSGAGILSVTGAYDIASTAGGIRVGVITASTLVVGTAISVSGSGGDVGIGTGAPRNAILDVEGETRLKSFHEVAITTTSASNQARLDLSQGQNFELTTSENITDFNIVNCVASSTKTFTLKLTQDASTAYTVGIDTFRKDGGDQFSVLWPGGVVPTVTAGVGATDIYSFMTFDGGTTLFGVIGGQNFS